MVTDEFYKAYHSVDIKSMEFLFYYTCLKKEHEESGEIITRLGKEEIVKKFIPNCYFSV